MGYDDDSNYKGEIIFQLLVKILTVLGVFARWKSNVKIAVILITKSTKDNSRKFDSEFEMSNYIFL